MQQNDGQNLRDRTFTFACDIVNAASRAARPGAWPLLNQLVRSGTSIGANLVEAKSASSRREFIRMCEIALREARETLFWLRVCVSVSLLLPVDRRLVGEADELVRILSTIVLRTKRRRAATNVVAAIGWIFAIWTIAAKAIQF